MEKIKDILESIKERLTNPLIFSFICSWLVINWKITIGIFIYNSSQIEKTGSKTIFDFIDGKLDRWNSFWIPLLIAVIYVLAIPIIKNLIKALNAWAIRWGNNWTLNIIKGGKVPIEKYLWFRDEYEKRTKLLEEAISKESTNLIELNEVKTKLLELQSTSNSLQTKNTELNTFMGELYNNRILNGYWTNTYDDKKGLKGEENIYIEDGKYFLINQLGKNELVFNITDFYFNNQNNSLFFIKQGIINRSESFGNVKPNYLINRLSFTNNDLLKGYENNDIEIVYKRKN